MHDSGGIHRHSVGPVELLIRNQQLSGAMPFVGRGYILAGYAVCKSSTRESVAAGVALRCGIDTAFRRSGSIALSRSLDGFRMSGPNFFGPESKEVFTFALFAGRDFFVHGNALVPLSGGFSQGGQFHFYERGQVLIRVDFA